VNLAGFLQHIVSFTTTLDPRLAALLFVICAIGEFHLSIPYVLETVWLLVGFQLGSGVLSPLHFLGLWVAALAGREVGAVGLYRIGWSESNRLVWLYEKLRINRLIEKITARSTTVRNINIYSPFSVAYGRLFGLRIPITLALGVKKRPRPLLWGVLLSSIVWDAVYISLGTVFGSALSIDPAYMFLASLAGLTIIYILTFMVRRLRSRIKPASRPVSD
jgi:membrane-associated protein